MLQVVGCPMLFDLYALAFYLLVALSLLGLLLPFCQHVVSWCSGRGCYGCHSVAYYFLAALAGGVCRDVIGCDVWRVV